MKIVSIWQHLLVGGSCMLSQPQRCGICSLATRETAKQPATPGVAALSIHQQGYTTELREELDLHCIHGVAWIDLPDAGEEGQDGAANRRGSAQNGPG